MLVALLGLAIFYIYALIIFAFYRDWMWSANNGRHCRTIYECFISVLHHGLVEGPYTVNIPLTIIVHNTNSALILKNISIQHAVSFGICNHTSTILAIHATDISQENLSIT